MSELFRASSQFRHWSFTEAELAALKRKGIRSAPPSETSLDERECEQFVYFFASDRLGAVCQRLRLPSHVRGTAAAYFRRFYLQNSVNKYDPRLLLPTCVFLAAKSENCFVSAQTLAAALESISSQQILALEFELFSELHFTLAVHTALWPLQGFFLDIQAQTDVDPDTLGSMHDSARKLVISCFANDAIFLYSPSRIALAALMDANEFVVTEYMAQAMDGPNRALDTLLASVQACRQLLQRGDMVEMNRDELKSVSKKLKLHFAESQPQPDTTDAGLVSANDSIEMGTAKRQKV